MDNEDVLLREVALRNASSILRARRQAEQELQEATEALERKTEQLALSLAQMKATLDATTDAVLATDQERRITAWNERFARMWQVSQATLERRDHRQVLEVLASQFVDSAGFLQVASRIDQEAVPESLDVLRTLDGRVIERHSRPQVLDGRLVGRVWSYRDVTDQHRSQEALRDESRALELLNRIGLELASHLDLQEVLQAVTDAGTQVSGARFGAFFHNVESETGESYQLFTLSGAPREAFERFGMPRATPVFGPTFKGERIVRSDDITQEPQYGAWAPHHGVPQGHLPVRSYLAAPVVSRDGRVIGGLFFGHPEPGVFTRRSEWLVAGLAAQAAIAVDNARLYEAAQRSAEERRQLLDSERAARGLAERMSALKDDFLATLSHELRTPLSAILGWTHLLRQPKLQPPDLEKGVDVIERSARAQVKLIDDLLDMNRVATGKVRLDLEPLDPCMLLQAAVESAAPAARTKDITIESRLSPGAGEMQADAARLQQIVGNLLSNAIKFTPQGGRITVALERSGPEIMCTVADTGVGILPDFLPHVFERFRQAESSRSRRYGGLGLGLAIVKNLVELHGGTVRAESAGQGHGSTFMVRLPVAAVSAESVPQAPGASRAATEPVPDLAGVKVLLIDDDPDSLELARRFLQESGAQIFTASRPDQGLLAVVAQRPDVLVSDLGMPGMDGFELLRRIRRLGPEQGGNVPAIALTAFARPQDREQSLQAGFVAHLTKPIEPAELLAAVARLAHRAALPAA